MIVKRKECIMDTISFSTTIGSFLTDLGSDLPAPGGGAVSGLSGALGSALGRMVASLTLGRKKYEPYAEDAMCISVELGKKINLFMDLSDRDAQAYSSYMKAASLPKTTDEEKAIRKDTMQDAIRSSAAVPYETLQACLDTLSMLELLYGRSNTTCAGDLAAGAMELSVAAKTAWLNVLANLPYFSERTDADELFDKSRELLNAVTSRASLLYEKIENDLRSKF